MQTRTTSFLDLNDRIAAGQLPADTAAARAALGLGSIATQDASALSAKAPLNSPALTGTPTVPTAAGGTNTTQAASTAFVRGEVAALINSAPATLDTLGEIAAQLASDESAAAALVTVVASKADNSALTATNAAVAANTAALAFSPLSLPKLMGWWDASNLTDADGTAISKLPDRSGRNQDVTQSTAASKPVVKASGQGGLRTLNFSGGKSLAAATFAAGGLMQGAALAQPFTYVAVLKAPASGAGTNRAALSSSAGSQCSLLLNTFGSYQLNAGSNGTNGGPDLSDGNFHVVVACFDTGSATVFVDGFLVSAAASQSHGTNTLAQFTIGAVLGGSTPFGGEFAEGGICNDRLTFAQVKSVTTYLSTKWGLGLSVPNQDAVTYQDAADASSINCRVWLPKSPGATAPLLIWSHQSGGNAQITTGYNLYPIVHALVNEGWVVIATDQGGQNTWGNATAVSSLLSAYNLANGIVPVSNVVLLGASMGGLPTALAVAQGTLPAGKVKGALLVDGVTNLSSMYAQVTYRSLIETAHGITAGTLTGATTVGATSVPTTASFPTVGTQLTVGAGTANVETVTTTAASTGTSVAVTALTRTHASADPVSDYPTKTVNRDPSLLAASGFAGVRWRFFASAADTSVPKSANADQFATLLASAATPPAESSVVAHLSGHLAGQSHVPWDMVAYVRRCLAG